MSIVNVVIREQRILAAVDTEARGAGVQGGKMNVTKLMIFPHVMGLATGRGYAPFFASLFGGLCMIGPTFDHIVAAAPLLTTETFRQVALRFAAGADADPTIVVLAGWSDMLQRMTIVEFEQTTRAQGFTVRAPTTFSINPWGPSIERLSKPRTVNDFVALGRAQRALLRAECGPDVAAGGALVYAELHRAAAGLRIVHQFNDAAEAEAAE